MRKSEVILCAGLLALAACQDSQTHAAAAERVAPSFDMRSFEKTRPGCGDHGSRTQACVSFRAAWPEMKGGSGEAVAKMNAAVLSALGFPGGRPAMEPFSDALMENWQLEHRGPVRADSTWFERRMVQVLARRPQVWSFQVDRIGQTGKALPFNERSYLNLDPRTGTAVALETLLDGDAQPRLAEFADKQLHAELGLPSQASLPFKGNVLETPDQFAFTSAGIVLAWKSEALNNPSASLLEITVPWREARSLVKSAAVKPPSADAEQGF